MGETCEGSVWDDDLPDNSLGIEDRFPRGMGPWLILGNRLQDPDPAGESCPRRWEEGREPKKRLSFKDSPRFLVLFSPPSTLWSITSWPRVRGHSSTHTVDHKGRVLAVCVRDECHGPWGELVPKDSPPVVELDAEGKGCAREFTLAARVFGRVPDGRGYNP